MDRRGFYFCHILYKKGRKELKGVSKNKREKGRKNIAGLLIQLMEVRKAQNGRLQEQSIFGRGEFGGGLAWPLGGGTTIQKLLDIGWTWGTARGECLANTGFGAGE